MGLDTPPVEQELEHYSRDQLLDMLKSLDESGIRISFAGKGNAARLARKVRPRVMRRIQKYSAGSEEEQAKNLVVEGENLQTMATLYRERGSVDLVLTDPPYNTGNDWRYNDRWDKDPNDTGIGDWVAADDGARHTKWMKFMWPRLQMMKAMLKPEGVLAICIDHRELFRLGQMLDELFGEENRIAIINWEKSAAARSDNKHVSTSTEYVLVYANDIERTTTATLPRTADDNRRYSNPDDDPLGDWREGNLSAKTPSTSNQYAIQSPFTGELHYPPGTRSWAHAKGKIKGWLEEWGSEYEERDIDDGRSPALILAGTEPGEPQETARTLAEARLKEGEWPFVWFGRDGAGGPRTKTYLSRISKGKVPVTYWADENFTPLELGSTSWDYSESGRSSDGAAELTAVVGTGHGFETVKPLKLFQKLIQLWCPPNGLILDPFAGSGTTGHVVLAMNEMQDAERRFILIEQGRPDKGDSYARTLLADRMQRVISGDWSSSEVTPISGGYRFVTLAKKVDADVLLAMERVEMIDTVVASHSDKPNLSASELVTLVDEGWEYLVARNSKNEGLFLVWSGPDGNTDFTEAVYEVCSLEAEKAGLTPVFHVYARLYLYQTSNVTFYQIPDRILTDFGLDLRTESFIDENP